MNYDDTVNWLFRQLPMYQSKGKSAYKEDLSNTILLSNYLKNPETKFKSIHVGGTNGKGSTSHMLASILQEAGYKVGLYTSPHLKDYRERIRINGKMISKQFVMGFVKKHKSFFENHSLSFFEMTVGLAFDYFAKKKVDIAIIEVGLGGRLDSTNIITPELSVITNIGLDHIQFLGDTLPLIAKEKAGIIKSNIPIVIGETHLETKAVFQQKAKLTNSKIYFADELVTDVLESDLKGNYQQNNIKTVIQSIEVLNTLGFIVNHMALTQGLHNVTKNTGIQGRWQILSNMPKIICDTAHNIEGLTIIIKQLESLNYNQLHIVFGMVNDKDANQIISLLPKDAKYYLAKPNINRGMPIEKLSNYFHTYGLEYQSFKTVSDAFNFVKTKAINEDVIFVGGSTFVVAEII